MPTYNFYTDEYFGDKIAEADFPRLSLRAKTYLNSLGRNLSDVPLDALKMAICAVSEAWQTNEQGGELISQSVGSWSKSFAQKKPKSDDQRLREAAQLYLVEYCNLSVGWV